MKNLLYFVLVVLVLTMVSGAFGTSGGGDLECHYGDDKTTWLCPGIFWGGDCKILDETFDDVCGDSGWWLWDACTGEVYKASATKEIRYAWQVSYDHNYEGVVCQVDAVWVKCGATACAGGLNCRTVSINDCGCSGVSTEIIKGREVCVYNP